MKKLTKEEAISRITDMMAKYHITPSDLDEAYC